MSGFDVGPADLNIHRSRQTEVQDGIDEATGLKIGTDFREVVREALADAIHVFVAANFVTFLQAGLNESRVLGGIRRVHRRKARSDADVRYDDPQVLRRDFFVDDIFNFFDIVLGSFEARPGWRFKVDHELAGVSARKVSNTEHRKKSEA